MLEGAGPSRGVAEPLGFGLVVVVITYLSIVVGELAPKRLALREPGAIACRVAPGMALLSRIATPVAWLLDASIGLVFRLFGLGGMPKSSVTDEEDGNTGAVHPGKLTSVTERPDRALAAIAAWHRAAAA